MHCGYYDFIDEPEYENWDLICNECGHEFTESEEFDGAFYCPVCNSDDIERK